MREGRRKDERKKKGKIEGRKEEKEGKEKGNAAAFPRFTWRLGVPVGPTRPLPALPSRDFGFIYTWQVLHFPQSG